MKNLAILLCAIALSACAAASKPGAMVAELTEATIISDNSGLRQAVSVGDVGGGKETSPLWKSNVSSEDFAESLRQSFAAHAMLATDEGDYRLDAELIELKQPFAGFNMTVTSIVKYTLTDLATSDVVFEETIEEAYTAKTSDAFLGVERLRLANEGSIKGNITSLIKAMIEQVSGDAHDGSMEVVEETAEEVSS